MVYQDPKEIQKHDQQRILNIVQICINRPMFPICLFKNYCGFFSYFLISSRDPSKDIITTERYIFILL